MSDGRGFDIRPATVADRPAIAAVYADAFADDPFHSWLFPDRAGRADQLGRWFGWLTSHYGDSEVVQVAGDSAAAATWHPPLEQGVEPPTPDPARRDAFRSFARDLFGDDADVRLEGMRSIVRATPREPHWYLATVGTVGAWRGTGIGAALIRAMLDRCDAESVPAHLESSNLRNIPFYERLGFSVSGRVDMPDGGAFVTQMWRPAGG